jgi:hypothetical protein
MLTLTAPNALPTNVPTMLKTPDIGRQKFTAARHANKHSLTPSRVTTGSAAWNIGAIAVRRAGANQARGLCCPPTTGYHFQPNAPITPEPSRPTLFRCVPLSMAGEVDVTMENIQQIRSNGLCGASVKNKPPRSYSASRHISRRCVPWITRKPTTHQGYRIIQGMSKKARLS